MKGKDKVIESLSTEMESNCAKLSDLCLRSVIQNFKRFMVAWKFAKRYGNHTVEKHFQALQIICSKPLFEKFSKTEYFLKYLDFFINPSLKEIVIDLSKLNNHEIFRTVERLKAVGHTLTKLHLFGQISTFCLLDLVLRLPNVKSLALYQTRVPAIIFDKIGKFCTSLEMLSVASCTAVTDAGLQQLFSIDKRARRHDGKIPKNYTLQYLDVTGTSVTYKGIAFVLKHFPNMLSIKHETVFIAICYIHKCDIEHKIFSAKKKFNLTSSEISVSHLDIDALKMCYSVCPYIDTLTISHISNQKQLNTCVGFAALKEVVLHLDVPIDISPFLEVRGGNLTTLHVINHSFERIPICLKSSLKNLLKLECLYLSDIDLKPLREYPNDLLSHVFPNLKSLGLSVKNLSRYNIIELINLLLSRSPNLEKLCLISVRCITPAFVNSIAFQCSLSHICELEIKRCDITVAAAEKLALALPNLRTYLLESCEIDDVESEAMQRLKRAVTVICKP